MKYILIALMLIGSVQAQNKHDNQIIISGVTFPQIVNSLMDNGYTINKIDSNYKTVNTEFRNCPLKGGGASTVNISIWVRVKDSTAYITGKWYSFLGLSRGLFESSREPGPMDIHQVDFSWGANKLLFGEMNKFAESLKQPLLYSKVNN